MVKGKNVLVAGGSGLIGRQLVRLLKNEGAFVRVVDKKMSFDITLDESIEEGIQLFEHILANVQPDIPALENTILDKLKERDDAKLSKRSILYGGLLNYGQYGKDSPIKHNLNKEELNNLDPNDLVAKIKNLTSFQHYIYYYGRKEVNEVKSLLDKFHLTPNELQPIKQAKKFTELSMDSNKVYFVNYDMVQSELMMLNQNY